MRIDLFLKASRIVPRRTLAQELCDKNRVLIDGAAAKSSKEVKVGNALEVRFGKRTVTYRVEQLPASKQVSKQDAAELYTVINETENDDLLSGQ